MIYKLYDYYDKGLSKGIRKKFNKILNTGDTFKENDVSYKVEKVLTIDQNNPIAVIKMLKYKIPNTSTQFVHNCRSVGKRLKMHGLAIQKCPHCKVIFWKDRVDIPEQIEIDKIYSDEESNQRKM